MNTIVIGIINHSEIEVISGPQLSYLKSAINIHQSHEIPICLCWLSKHFPMVGSFNQHVPNTNGKINMLDDYRFDIIGK